MEQFVPIYLHLFIFSLEFILYICGNFKTIIMSKRKIFEKQIVDLQTGEIVSEELHYRQNNEETFGMHRTTEGVDWIFQFTGIELQMIIILLEIEDLKTGLISLTPLMKKHLSNKFNKTSRYIREIISSLQEKDTLIKITTQDIMLNPIYFYKGGTKQFKNKLSNYKNYKDEIKGNNTIK